MEPMTTTDRDREVAVQVVDGLLTTGSGEEGHRLEIMQKDESGRERGLGGWGRVALVREIAAALATAREEGRKAELPAARFTGLKVHHSPHIPRGTVVIGSAPSRLPRLRIRPQRWGSLLRNSPRTREIAERAAREWWGLTFDRGLSLHPEVSVAGLADAIEAAIIEAEQGSTLREMRAEAVRVLNEAIALDPEAVRRICNARAPCNEELSVHPTIQVGSGASVGRPEHDWLVGVLGIVNGICGVDDNGWGFVGIDFDEAGKPIKARLLGTEDRKPPSPPEEGP
jgi:hypothetical protein